MPSSYWGEFRVFLPAACVVSVGSMWAWGCYGRTWRHASIDEAVRLLAAGVTTGLILVLTFMWGSERVPLTVLVAGPILATFLYGMVRFQQRLFAFRRVVLHRFGHTGRGGRRGHQRRRRPARDATIAHARPGAGGGGR